MAILDHISRLPGFGRLFQRTAAATTPTAGSPGAGGGRDEVVRHPLRAFDTADWGSSRGSWLTHAADQPYETDPQQLGEQLPWEIRRIFSTDAKVQMVVRATITTALTAEWQWKPVEGADRSEDTGGSGARYLMCACPSAALHHMPGTCPSAALHHMLGTWWSPRRRRARQREARGQQAANMCLALEQPGSALGGRDGANRPGEPASTRYTTCLALDVGALHHMPGT